MACVLTEGCCIQNENMRKKTAHEDHSFVPLNTYTMKEHLINLLYEQFKFSSFMHHFNSIGINIPGFELNNNQIVLDIIGFPQNGIIESDLGPDHNTYNREQLDGYLGRIIRQLVKNEEVVLTQKGLHISEQYELLVKGELAKYVDMLLKELHNENVKEQDVYLDNGQSNLPLNLRCPRMTSVLSVHFNRGFKDFEIYNPVVLPVEGECMDFEWKNFLDDEEEVKKLTEFGEDNIWMCHILFKKYYKNQIETHILLMDEEDYKNGYE